MHENIPPGLAQLARGRDLITLAEVARVLNKAPQTLRKLHSADGAVYGMRPRKIGGRLLWAVADVARVLAGGGEK